MCTQECALYGELVRHLRDHCVERIAELGSAGGKEAARVWADDVIRNWFFTPQEDLHGDAPRDVIWREQKGEPNIVSDDHKHEIFFDDCPLCEVMKEMDEGGEWHWHYDDGGFPLIAEYDPEGWEARWAEDVESFKKWDAEQKNADKSIDSDFSPDFPIEDLPDFSKN